MLPPPSVCPIKWCIISACLCSSRRVQRQVRTKGHHSAGVPLVSRLGATDLSSGLERQMVNGDVDEERGQRHQFAVGRHQRYVPVAAAEAAGRQAVPTNQVVAGHVVRVLDRDVQQIQLGHLQLELGPFVPARLETCPIPAY